MINFEHSRLQEVNRRLEDFVYHLGTKSETRGDNRERILISALKLLANCGAESCTTRRIAKEAEIKPAALYTYFPNKESIAAAAILNALKGFLVFTLGPSDDLKSPLSRLHGVTRRHTIYRLEQSSPLISDSLFLNSEFVRSSLGVSGGILLREVQALYFQHIHELVYECRDEPDEIDSKVATSAIIALCEYASISVSEEVISLETKSTNSEIAERNWMVIQRILGKPLSKHR